jgi:glycosyltransferase involved in cell wall biosynthesis
VSIPRVTVVIPARNDADLLAGLLDCVMAQASQAGVAVLTVDDASDDDTAAVALTAGARVITLPKAVGPYQARNAGWRATSSELLVFTDVRARPGPGWLTALVGALDADPAAAIVGGDVVVRAGDSLAGRVFARREGLSPKGSMEDSFLPYLSTCNLATRRTVLDALDGFRKDRSGGDLDLCWRAQLAGCGTVRLVEQAPVEWVPRDTVRAMLRQIYRYGVTRPHLEASFASAGKVLAPPPTRARSAAYEVRELMRSVRRNPRADLSGQLVERVWDFVFWEGYRRSWVELYGSVHAVPPPAEALRTVES